MIDRCYNQTDLVALYDLVNLTSPDWEYYLALASILSGPTGSVLDAGCGTGALTIEVIYMTGHAFNVFCAMPISDWFFGPWPIS